MRGKKVIYRPRLQRQGALVDKLISYWPLSVNYGRFLRPAEDISVKFSPHVDGILWVSENMCGCICGADLCAHSLTRTGRSTYVNVSPVWSGAALLRPTPRSAGDFEIQAEQRFAYPRQLRLKLCDAVSARYARPVKAIKQSPRICRRQRQPRSHRFRTDAPDRVGGGRRTGKAAFCIPDMELHTHNSSRNGESFRDCISRKSCCPLLQNWLYLRLSCTYKERCPQQVSQILL